MLTLLFDSLRYATHRCCITLLCINYEKEGSIWLNYSPDAEVNTAVTILEKEVNRQKRSENLVKFVRVKQKMDLEHQIRLIQEAKESFEDEQIRINVVKQSNLKQGKWSIYLRAPPVYQKLLTNPKVKPLGEVAEVFFGIKTGYNDYFILSKEKAEEWG